MKRILLYVVYAAVIIGLLVAIVLAFRTKAAAPGKTPTIANKAQQQKHTATPKPANPAPTPQPQTTPSPPQPSPTTPVQQPAGTDQNLSNTGPGDVVLLFVATVSAGTIAYSYFQRKKLA